MKLPQTMAAADERGSVGQTICLVEGKGTIRVFFTIRGIRRTIR